MMEDNLPKLVREISAIRSQYDQLFVKSQRAQRLFEERDSLQRQQIAVLQQQNDDLKTKMHDLKHTVKKNFASQLAYNEDVKELEKLARVQEARIIELEDQILGISAEKTKISREMALKVDDNEYLKQDIARLKQKLDEDLVSRSEYDIGITKFEQLQSSIDENMITKVKYNQLEENYRDFRETFNQKVQAIVAEKENLEHNLKSSKEIKDLLSVRLAETEANLERCQEKLVNSEQENAAMKASYMTQIGALKQQSRRDGDQIKALTQSKLESQSIETDFQDNFKKLSMEKSEQARKIANLENMNEQLKVIVNQMTDKAKYFEMQILSLHQAVVESEGDDDYQNFDSNNIHSESPLLSSSDIILTRAGGADNFNSILTSSKFPFGDVHKKEENTLNSSSTFIPHDI